MKHTKRHLYFYFQGLPFIRSYFRSIAVLFPNKVKGERERGIRERRSREREKGCSWKNKRGGTRNKDRAHL